jgi:uncharacterized Zn-binding protein involved in type VI secretion
MSGFIITKGDSLTCTHGGAVTPDFTSLRVKVSGQPAVLQMQPYTITTCPAGQSKCTKGTWTKGAMRVTANGTPVAISTGTSQCVPAGFFKVVFTQQRVEAT